ncbi:MAG: AMP-binding protein [Parvularculaceae bacterium]
MSNANFFADLRAAYAAAPDRPFLSLPDGRVFTYGEIDALSARMAGALLAAGAKPGDRIAVQVEKSPENVALYLGAMRAGLVYVPLNTAYTAAEISYFLGDAAPSVFVCAPERLGELTPTAKSVGAVLTLGTSNNGTLADAARAAARRALSNRAAKAISPSSSMHVRHDRAIQGRDADPSQPRIEREDSQTNFGVSRQKTFC